MKSTPAPTCVMQSSAHAVVAMPGAPRSTSDAGSSPLRSDIHEKHKSLEPECNTDDEGSCSDDVGSAHASTESTESSQSEDDSDRCTREQRASGLARENTCLSRENERLRRQVADLTGALKARDMEIASLRERCSFLSSAVEQQDEIIAKIYATCANPLEPTQSMARRVAGLTPSADFAQIGDDHAAGHPAADPARLMLESRLDSMGFQCNKVDQVLQSLSDGLKEQPRCSGDVEILNEALDRLLYPPKTGSDVEESPNAIRKRRPSTNLERSGSSTSDEDYARSAGFLRKPNRKLSGRLSVSDFGLLGDDSLCSSPSRTWSNADDSSCEDGSASTCDSTNLTRQQTLFDDFDVPESRPAAGGIVSQNEDKDEGLTYAEFLERIGLPASRDVLDAIRQFVGSILGPRGDGSPPRSSDHVDYDFYGNHEFKRRCQLFFKSMDDMLQHHPAWCHASETTLAKARDGIEKYVMDKVANIAMNQLDECREWKLEDQRLERRMNILSLVTPDMLDIKPCMRNEVVWSMAEDELRRINSFRSPGDKINCIVRCCSVIFSVLNLARGDSSSRPGADDFLPVFIFIVLHSGIPRLYSNCEYIAAYRNPADLMSKAGYCFVNLRSALEFISVLDASMLSVSPAEFQRLYDEREQELKLNDA
ncbi:TPA: hypothetical protein N0F65_005515 [Lagenidium giganteum]|uniref:VPS9 domain-containing protein n=1 Tax=Lagenidium giganteum TaxID=4803 RepID=A0AAV2YGB4_9STRA|nr:TPA: hypothetical protein N0F65_005515 [Lagenidium giganteum]